MSRDSTIKTRLNGISVVDRSAKAKLKAKLERLALNTDFVIWRSVQQGSDDISAIHQVLFGHIGCFDRSFFRHLDTVEKEIAYRAHMKESLNRGGTRDVWSWYFIQTVPNRLPWHFDLSHDFRTPCGVNLIYPGWNFSWGLDVSFY